MSHTSFLNSEVFFLLALLQVLLVSTSSNAVDPNGYVVYCPCMGRFGNQADQFLGALAFAKALDRTLILPPWVEYRRNDHKAVMEPFDTYFQVDPFLEYHRVITMEVFMKELAPTVWPPGSRKVFCYSARHGSSKESDCNAKEGSPFGPFWDWFNIDFDESVIFGPLFYDTDSPGIMSEWNKKYPSKSYPVLAFVGPPASFPVTRYNAKLHKYMKWSEEYDKMARDFIAANIPDSPFIGIHLRNGPDFERACEHVPSTPNMFASKQCTGERGEYGTTTTEMCFPSVKTITEKVKKEVARIGAKTVFIATDYNDLIPELSKVLKNVKLVKQPEPASPLLDLAILGRSDHFIGNCVSTFTAFVKRERDALNLPSSFWAFQKNKKRIEL
ncbi:GDP-fucose protein O-fucosyltransferase 1-like [Physella acuta]|uniref:GDP-fucose protein O-fucosyltransferase 1-like n=1 Tax=Physella acuta TaxID=109671 RepID=UPI0027DE92A5|nr:GDP-fucose protein O-fucosyltransferase 1-like [Physella acuta]XP_059177922.1 GDP-fucose protein O-fucosyltransferase 1-like [Physella acuta]XP_059177923.1 GDP-fucose protein O-fucosyltransferase 1-like [Physella acuta]XP_059177924.1 GDP-fucose protein O-fucosyltransferase 1-like [Physella acuta]XP_059177925.1 GDP-fucose protein O-fucosyltransferase 1-like [Physella acuta]XP_059177926.1 GDP-fucose protein O-fucosyltransferase 1-like [Physella acuta]XP_059177927.1 GDP-fucose protein O-fucos